MYTVLPEHQSLKQFQEDVIAAIDQFNERSYQVVIVTGPKRYDNVLNKLKHRFHVRGILPKIVFQY